LNIFVLDTNPVKAAIMQADQHVVKMVLESAQMLCTAHRVLTPNIEYPHQYRKTHFNHPCNVWLRESVGNYFWLLEHFMALCTEFRYRRQKIHLCDKKFLIDTDWIFEPPAPITETRLTEFKQCMRDEFKVDGDPVSAYRAFYIQEKLIEKKLTYTWGRPIPSVFQCEV